MPTITFLIGNGFDLQVGLKTRYIDFYKIYCDIKNNDSDLITKFKKQILQDEAQGWKNWSDFEFGMGQQAKEFTSSGDFLSCFDDFVVQFNTYLSKECDMIDWNSVDQNIKNEFLQSILAFNTRVKSVPQSTFAKALSVPQGQNTNYAFLQFNYTNAFDKLFEFVKENFNPNTNKRKISCNLHIHGELDKHPVIGVDSVEQIKSSSEKPFSESIKTVFVKPLFLEAIQARNVSVQIPAKKAIAIIKSSNIICSFGASIGETDKTWWKEIGNWLQGNDKYLIIFDVCGDEDDGISPLSFLSRENDVNVRKEAIYDRVANLAEWTDDIKEANREKVVIELDNAMFNLKLPQKAKA
jgi:hypothetical protein